jgi:hypothetical protein
VSFGFAGLEVSLRKNYIFKYFGKRQTEIRALKITQINVIS